MIMVHTNISKEIKGVGVGKISFFFFFFKELTHRLRTYELRGQGKKKNKKKQDKQTLHTILQKQSLSLNSTCTPLTVSGL